MKLTKTPQQITLMKEGGAKLANILDKLLAKAQPGVTLKTIDAMAEQLIAASGGTPSFKTVKGYKWSTCLCVNDVVVHGVPTDYALKEGDVLTVDVGLLFGGLHTDTAWTKIVHGAGFVPDPTVTKLLSVGEEALQKAIAVSRAGNRIGHISKVLQETVEGAGYSVMRTLIGHGIGRELHEPPQVPGFLMGSVGRTPELVPGMTIAIEIIYAMGGKDVIYDTGDGWSVATKDGSIASVFEHTIAITEQEPIVLTQKEN